MQAFFQGLLASLLFKIIAGIAAALMAAIASWYVIVKQNIQKKDMEKAEEDLKKANEINDDTQRISDKAHAACELEKAINPDSDC